MKAPVKDLLLNLYIFNYHIYCVYLRTDTYGIFTIWQTNMAKKTTFI